MYFNVAAVTTYGHTPSYNKEKAKIKKSALAAGPHCPYLRTPARAFHVDRAPRHRPSRLAALAFQPIDRLCYPTRPRPSPPPEHIPIPPHPTCCARLASEATQRAPPGPAQHVRGGGSPPCLLCFGLAAFVRRRAGIGWWSTTRRTPAARGGATCLVWPRERLHVVGFVRW